MSETVIPVAITVYKSPRMTFETAAKYELNEDIEVFHHSPEILKVWSFLSRRGYPLKRIISSAMPPPPKKSPTALVTRSTILKGHQFSK